MSVIIQGPQLRTIAFGVQVLKAAQLQPATGTATLFTVSGGQVLVTSLLGLVVAATPGTVNTLALGTIPATGTAENAGIATATSTASAEAGTWIGLQASSALGGALVVGTKAGSSLFLPPPFIVDPGTITWTTTGTAATGTIAWYLTYVPLDAGAAVA